MLLLLIILLVLLLAGGGYGWRYRGRPRGSTAAGSSGRSC